jgi:hypothetical protein
MINICILYLKYLENYLETLHSHFQLNCHFKMFKNSGSDITQWRSRDQLWAGLPSLALKEGRGTSDE